MAFPGRSIIFESSAIHEDAIPVRDGCAYCLFFFFNISLCDWRAHCVQLHIFFRLSALGWANSPRRKFSSRQIPSETKWSDTQWILCYLKSRKRWFLITILLQVVPGVILSCSLRWGEIHAISMLIETALPALAVWTGQVCQRRRKSIYSQRLQNPGAYSPSFLDLHADLIWG